MEGYGACCASGLHTHAMKYRDYLNSDEWKKKRAEARKRAGGKCKVCGSRARLETHHKTYKNLGKERQHELVVLCDVHHEQCHAFIKNWHAKKWKPLSDYALTMKFVAREKKKLRKPRHV